MREAAELIVERQGGKSLRARIRRPSVPESETEMMRPAHVRVRVGRKQ